MGCAGPGIRGGTGDVASFSLRVLREPARRGAAAGFVSSFGKVCIGGSVSTGAGVPLVTAALPDATGTGPGCEVFTGKFTDTGWLAALPSEVFSDRALVPFWAAGAEIFEGAGEEGGAAAGGGVARGKDERAGTRTAAGRCVTGGGVTRAVVAGGNAADETAADNLAGGAVNGGVVARGAGELLAGAEAFPPAVVTAGWLARGASTLESADPVATPGCFCSSADSFAARSAGGASAGTACGRAGVTNTGADVRTLASAADVNSKLGAASLAGFFFTGASWKVPCCPEFPCSAPFSKPARLPYNDWKGVSTDELAPFEGASK